MDVKQWVSFLLYLFFTGTSTFVNAFGVRALPGLDRLGGLWGGFGLGIICITILACSSGKYQPPKKVFADFINETGVRSLRPGHVLMGPVARWNRIHPRPSAEHVQPHWFRGR